MKKKKKKKCHVAYGNTYFYKYEVALLSLMAMTFPKIMEENLDR